MPMLPAVPAGMFMPTSSCSHMNVKLILWCQDSLSTRTTESCSSQESPPLARRKGDKNLVVNESDASDEHMHPEGQLQNRDLAPSSLLMWWCKYDSMILWNMPSPGQAQAAWGLVTCTRHCCESQLTKCKVCGAVGLPGWSSGPDWETPVIIFQHGEVNTTMSFGRSWGAGSCLAKTRGAIAGRNSHNRVCSWSQTWVGMHAQPYMKGNRSAGCHMAQNCQTCPQHDDRTCL